MRGFAKLLPLVLPLLAGCMTMTDIAATEAPAVAAETTITGICSVWLAISWSSQDTDQTIAEVKANNRARIGFGCT